MDRSDRWLTRLTPTMILDIKGPQIETGAVDAPPAYDELGGHQSDSPRFSSDQKSHHGPGEGPSSSSRSQVSQPSQRGSKSSVGSGINKTWFSWFSEKDTRTEVKQTVQSLVSRLVNRVFSRFSLFWKIRDVVKQPASPAAVSVLQSCLEACQSRGLSFQSIVSEKFIEGHCPLYWAIVKRSATLSQEDDDRVQLLDILLSIPLDSTTRLEAYLACMLSSDQILFQRLRHTPGDHSPSVSAAHELLIGDAPEDDVRSFDGEADHGEFRIVWKIAKFQRRMRAIGGVGTEVVARGRFGAPLISLSHLSHFSGRIWSLALSILPRDVHLSRSHLQAGTWVASVSLLAPSPATYLDAQFTIPEPIAEPLPSGSTPPLAPSSEHTPSVKLDHTASLPSTQSRKNSFVLPWATSHKVTRKTPITLRVSTETNQMEALPLLSAKQDLRDHVLSQPGSKTLIVPLSSHPNGDSLQYEYV